ncbi:MAG: SGNH/GDSL hydrolase family protein [Alphaproteobacteria bacterium]
MPAITKVEIEAAANKRVVFAHQSVGRNILDGVNTIANEHGVTFNLVETRTDSSGKAGIYHFAVGENGAPLKKISDFEQTLSAKPYGKIDIALVKLCYVDITRTSDALAIAKNYVATIKKLQTANPDTRFVAVTAPLTAVNGGVKEWLKKAVGRGSPDFAHNAKRKEFNDYLRKEFDSAHLFDLARIEAGAPTAEGIEAMRPEITDDGGHLNEKGQREAGAAFIKLLSAQ